MKATPLESSTFKVKVLISHLLGEVTEVFCSKLSKSPESLVFVKAGTLDLSDSHHKNCLNWSLLLRETLTIEKFSSRWLGQTFR